MSADDRGLFGGLGGGLSPAMVVALAGVALFSGAGASRPPDLPVVVPGSTIAMPVVPASSATTAPGASETPPLDTTWLDGQVRGSRVARLVDDYLGDTGCAAAAAALDTTRSRALAAGRLARQRTPPCVVDALIVTVAAYEDSNSRWQADRTLATIQGAMGALRYTLERFDLPGARVAGAGVTPDAADSDPDGRHGPGVLVFRRLSSAGAAGLRLERDTPASSVVEVLVVFTVPEMPTSGLERVPFLIGAHLVLSLQALPHPTGDFHARNLRVVGPFYSGSSLSLLRGIEEAALIEGAREPGQNLVVQVISGSATGHGNCAVLSGPLPHGGFISFERTVHEDRTLLGALQDHLGTIREEWRTGEGVALLVESNTGWGASLKAQAGPKGSGAARRAEEEQLAALARVEAQACGPQDRSGEAFEHALRLGFPLHIADRDESRQANTPSVPGYADLLGPAASLRLDDGQGLGDRLPTLAPALTDAGRDLTLAGILAQLQRRRIGAVGILGSDARDLLFLAREINRVLPDVILFGTEPDILMLHPEYEPYLRGMLVASSYPLQGHAQTLTHGEDAHENRVQFTSQAQQGLHNAMLQAIGPEAAIAPLLIDYRPPVGSLPGREAQCAGNGGWYAERPVPWIVAVGQREFAPVTVRPRALSPQDCAVIRARATSGGRTPPDDDDDYVFASSQERAMWLLVPGAVLALVGVVAAARRGPLPIARWLSPPARLARAEATPSRPAWGLPVGEWQALGTEHALLTGALVLAFCQFLASQVQVWAAMLMDPRWSSTVTIGITGPLALATLLGAVVLAGQGFVRLRLARLLPGLGAARTRRRAALLAWGAPALVAWLVLLAGVLFTAVMLLYLIRVPVTPIERLFAASRAFDLANMISPAPLLTAFPALVATWMVWSLRTLYYQRISPTGAGPLLRALTGEAAGSRRLSRAIASTLGTTLQPAGAYLVVPVAALVGVWLLLAPRVASIEGAAFGRVLLVGTMLGMLAASLELAQAAWLTQRVLRLLEHVRRHAVGRAVDATTADALDWRPALRPSPSPYPVIVRALRDAGQDVPRESGAVVDQERMPALRTQAWAQALRAAGTTLRHWRAGEPGAEERRLAGLVVAMLLQTLVTRVVRGFGIAAALLGLLLAGHLLTAFSGRSLALLLDIALILLTAGLAIRALLALERDHVLSRLWGGTPGGLNLNSGLVWRAVVYAGLPLLTILSIRFPEVGGRLATLVEPLRHFLPTP